MTMPMPIRGLIFDLDGVIADTHEFHYRSWKRLADEEGLPFDETDNEAVRGLTREASLRYVLARVQPARAVTPAEAAALMARKNRYFHESMAHIQPMPGVRPLLDEARAAGLRLGVGSASRNARTVLHTLGLLAHFHVVGDGHTVQNHKPAPDIFLWVAGALGLTPREILVLEDSQVGVTAGLNGGFYVAGISAQDTLHNAHKKLATLAGVSLATLLAGFPAAG